MGLHLAAFGLKNIVFYPKKDDRRYLPNYRHEVDL
jgi:hypothetical protein